MSRVLKHLLILFAVVGASCAHGGITAIRSDAGLPDRYITAICRDRHGLMWIGTRQGLATYDGYRFTRMRAPLETGIWVHKLLYQPAQDVLWVSTNQGIYLIQCDKQLAIPVSGNLFNTVAQNSRAATLFTPEQDLADSNKIIFSNRHQHYSLDTRSAQLRIIAKDTSVQDYPFKRVHRDYTFFGDEISLKARSNWSNTQAPPILDSTLRRIDLAIDIAQVDNGPYYIISKPAKLTAIDLAKNTSTTITSDLFLDRAFTCLFVDQNNIVWLGTNKGLIKCILGENSFEKMLFQKSAISVRPMAEDEHGRLYAGTYRGLFTSADQGATWTLFNAVIPYSMVNAADRYLYFVTESKGFFRIDKSTQKLETRFYKTRNLEDAELHQGYCIIQDNQGLLWIGTNNGIVQYDTASRLLSPYQVRKNLPPNTRVLFIEQNKRNRFWVGTDQGLFELDKTEGVVWQINAQTQPGLPGNGIIHASEDPFGRLWICTLDAGISRVSADRQHIETFRTESGLSDNETYRIAFQGKDYAWISTFNGLSRYNFRSGKFYNYYKSDGISSNEFNRGAFLRDSRGKLYFGSIDGITAFYPDSIAHAARDVRVFVSSVTKWDNESGKVLTIHTSGAGKDEIRLRSLDHSLTFYFGLTDYSNPENNIFRYRMPGLVNEWVSLEGGQPLRLNGLAAGKYTLEVMALDWRGTPAANTLTFYIAVRQAFYRSAWFYLILSVVAMGLLWLFFSLRLQHIRRVHQLREQIASDLHDEVGSLLTRITMTTENMRYSAKSGGEKTSKLEKITALSRAAASAMRDVLWSIDARNDFTGNLADYMREHAEDMLLPLGMELHVQLDINQKMVIRPLLRQQLFLIFKEAINNIAKHSDAKDVHINYRHHQDGFRLTIENDGARDHKKSHGQGLRNMDMRAKRIHAEIAIEVADGHFRFTVCG